MALVVVKVAPSSAQFDLGGSLGIYAHRMVPGKKVGHTYGRVENIVTPAFVSSLFYREHWGRHADLGIELQVTRKTFDVYATNGSLAGSTGIDASGYLDLMHLGLFPAFHLDSSGNSVLRLGLQFGFKLGASMTGETWNSYPYQWQRDEFVNGSPDAFWGDIRFMIGLGFRVPIDARSAVEIDPYASTGITTLVAYDLGVFSFEFGLRLGYSRRCANRSLTRIIDRATPTPPAGPNW